MTVNKYRLLLPYFIAIINLILGFSILKITFLFYQTNQIDKLNTILLTMSLASMALSLNFNTFSIAQGTESKYTSYTSFLAYCATILTTSIIFISIIPLPLILALTLSLLTVLIIAEANQSYISKNYWRYILYSILPVGSVFISTIIAYLTNITDIVIGRITLPIFIQIIFLFSIILRLNLDVKNLHQMLIFGAKIIPTSLIMFCISNLIRSDEYLFKTYSLSDLVLALSILALFTVIVDTTQKLFMYLAKQGTSITKLLYASTILFTLALSMQIIVGEEIHKFIIYILTGDLNKYLGAFDIIVLATYGIAIRILSIVPNICLHLNLKTSELTKINTITLCLTLICLLISRDVVLSFVFFYIMQSIMFFLYHDWKIDVRPN